MNPICLVIPPSPFLLDERVFMSLGILRVAAVLEKEGHAVSVLDLSGIENYLEVVEDYCAKTPSGTFCLTATTPQMPSAAQIARTIREHYGYNQSCSLVLGGPHPTLTYAACRKEYDVYARGGPKPSSRAARAFENLKDLFNFVVVGDGERGIMEVVNWPTLVPHFHLIDADDPKKKFISNEQFLG